MKIKIGYMASFVVSDLVEHFYFFIEFNQEANRTPKGPSYQFYLSLCHTPTAPIVSIQSFACNTLQAGTTCARRISLVTKLHGHREGRHSVFYHKRRPINKRRIMWEMQPDNQGAILCCGDSSTFCLNISNFPYIMTNECTVVSSLNRAAGLLTTPGEPKCTTDILKNWIDYHHS